MYAKFYENRDALAMATKTLDGLARGGFMTILVTVFPAIPLMKNFWCHILKKCFMTMRCLCWPIPMLSG